MNWSMYVVCNFFSEACYLLFFIFLNFCLLLHVWIRGFLLAVKKKIDYREQFANFLNLFFSTQEQEAGIFVAIWVSDCFCICAKVGFVGVHIPSLGLCEKPFSDYLLIDHLT